MIKNIVILNGFVNNVKKLDNVLIVNINLIFNINFIIIKMMINI